MRRVALATVFFSAIALTARAQPAREHSSAPVLQLRSIAGRVLADDTGDPVANARVALTTAVPGAAAVLTDHEGRFTLTAPPSRVSIAASKSGYSRREIPLTAAEHSIEIRLVRGAVISGRVVDELGEPILGARVFVEKATGQSDGFSGEVATQTDDRGEYRLGGLQPGTFNLAVATMGAPSYRAVGPNQFILTSEPRTIYYPGVTTRAEAEPLRLQPGDEKPGTDLIASGGRSMTQMMMAAPAPDRSSAATAARNTGTIRGRVVSTDGRPVPYAQVRTLSRGGPAVPNGATPARPFEAAIVTADDAGRFEMLDMPAGSFQITASKMGYSMPGAPSPFAPPLSGAGPTVDLTDGETRERVDVTLARWGAMNGRVFDELGDPLQGVSVQLLQVRYQAGRRRLVAAGVASIPTDDLGRFRIASVLPGQYIVSATIGGVASEDVPGYTRSYFPGTPTASEAQFVQAGLSQEIAGIDFSMSREKTATISGTLLNAAGEPSTSGSVRLMPSRRSASGISVSVGARLMRDGRFEFPNVTPGQYIIQVDRGRKSSSTEGEFGMLPVTVDGADVTGLVLQTSAGSSIAGRVQFDSLLGVPAPRPGQIEITTSVIDPEQSPATPANADVHPDWTFEIRGVNGPRRLHLKGAPSEWTLKEIRVNGIDVTDRPLAFGKIDQSLTDVEVVLTDRVTEVRAAIVDDHARPAAGAHLVVFPIDRDRWYAASRYLRQVEAGADGTAAIAGLPPGSYYAAALVQIPVDGAEAWQDPAYLQSVVARASAFALGEGQKHVLNLELTSADGR
jgi:protocatechuate 3,4-dioxygenase beta subunit